MLQRPFIPSRTRAILHRLLRDGPLSRSQLHEKLALRKNTVSDLVEPLLAAGILREGATRHAARGRPHTQLEIDIASRRVLGISLNRGRVEAATVNLLGQLPTHVEPQPFRTPDKAVTLAAQTLRRLTTPDILHVAVAVPGFMDPEAHMLLQSCLFQGGPPASLQPLYDAVGKTPLVLGNITHALAASWLLHRRPSQSEDALIVYLEDGQIGSALLVQGRPNPGCVVGANELGHTRLAVKTSTCYCGQSGCLERIFDSKFLDPRAGPGVLHLRASAFSGHDSVLENLIELVAVGIANAVNLTRVHRLVLVTSFSQYPFFADSLAAAVRRLLLRELASRVHIEHWQSPAARTAPAAACLALAPLYYQGWQPHPAALATPPEFAKISVLSPSTRFGETDMKKETKKKRYGKKKRRKQS